MLKSFYRQYLPTKTISSLFQVQKKLKAYRSSKLNFLGSCFIADDRYAKVVWIHVAVFSEHDLSHF